MLPHVAILLLLTAGWLGGKTVADFPPEELDVEPDPYVELQDLHAAANDVAFSYFELPLGVRKLVAEQALPERTSNSQGKDLNQLKIEAQTIRIVVESIGIASGVMSTVQGGLNTAASAITVGLSDYARSSSRAQFSSSEASFAQSLYNDFNRAIDGSDYLGDAAKYIKLWNKIQKELNTGQLSSTLQQHADQLASSQAILDALKA